MNTASGEKALVDTLKAAGAGRADIIRQAAEYRLGWPYVFGAAGEMCTPGNRKKYAGYRPDHAAKIMTPCPVLSGKQSSCDTCKWLDTCIFDCRGFTRDLLALVGLSLCGGTVTAQWETDSNWAVKGDIQDLPKGLVCCVFREGHTGMYTGDMMVRHCSTVVKEEPLPGTPKWLRFGIPAGLYTTEELRKAGFDVDESRNIPTLRKGVSGEDVLDLQMLLNAKCGFSLELDGIFGAKTEAAVKAFQQAKGLTVDGIVGPKTRAALGLVFAEGTNVPGSASTGETPAPSTPTVILSEVERERNEVEGSPAAIPTPRPLDAQADEGGRGEESSVSLPCSKLLELRACLSDALSIINKALE